LDLVLARLRALSPGARAVLYMLLTVMCFAVLETTAKYLTRFYPVPQVVWGRYTIHMLLMLVILGPRMRLGLVRTAQPGSQLIRASLLLGSTLCNFGAVSVLPLAEVKAITFVSPLLVTLFAVWLLREKVTRDKWAAVVVGFAGTLFIVRPGTSMLSPAATLALGSALCYSLYQIMTRRLSDDENPIVTLFYTALVGFVAMSLVAPLIARPVALVHLPLFLLVGSMGVLGHYLLIRALELERASTLSPIGYLQLLWVTLLGFLVFGDLPDAHAVLGMAIIVGSGLYVAWGHHYRRREEPESAIE
jgi:drug/metabolite transporter (DMT)-like permease